MLIDSGAQVSSVSTGFCEHMTLKVHPLGRLLEGTGGLAIPYLGYVEVNLQILGIKGYNEKVLAVVRSKIIDRVMRMITKGELVRATVTWKQAHFDAVMSGSLQLPHTDSDWQSGEGESLPPQAPTLQHLRSSAWMMSGDLSVPIRGLPFPCHLGPFSNTWQHRCLGTLHAGSMCLLIQHMRPLSFPPP